ncbi:MAG: hypothetical protein J6Q89_04830 [Clostridia bacterium]|nr:hypothetical protein [Clostridia bacterium]
MNKTFKKVLAAFLVLCMIPAAVITAFAHGPGVAGNQTENQWHDLAQGQYIPETVVVDGEFDDAGWAVNEWSYVNTNNGAWDSEAPNTLNATASYKYQMHYDRNYFYFAAVIAMPAGVDEGTFAVYLSEQKVDNTYMADRGVTGGFTFAIVGNEVSVTAQKGGDELAIANGVKPSPATYTKNGVTYNNTLTDNGGNSRLEDELLVADVNNGIVTIEFRNKLDATIDMDYTIYGLNKKDQISHYVALWLDHGEGNVKNEAGNENDMLFYPVWSQGNMEEAVRTFEPTGDYWPIKNGGMTPKQVDSAITGITIDGNLEELLWQNANADFTHVDSASGYYYKRPYENDPLSYSFVAYSDGSKIYGAAILNVEAQAPADGLLGTEFGIWFDNGVDERLDIKTTGQSPCEYEFFKNKTSISIYPSNNTTDNKGTITQKDQYATEVRYYINQNCNFRLYGTQFDNNRGDKADDEHFDVNPDVAPDAFYNGQDAEIKVNGTHYQYDYKIINGKTYVEFFVDLKSVRCDNGTCRMFVYTQHDTHGSGTAQGKYSKVYYPKLKGEDQEVQNLFWVTNYNNLDDRYYGTINSNGNKGQVNDNLGVIFSTYANYSKYAKEFKWWHQVCFQKVSGTNKYKVIQIIPAQGETDEDKIKWLDSHTGSDYLWYAMSTGTYYSENYYVGDRKLVAPLDKRNYMCTEAFSQLRYWSVGDEVEFNFNPSEVKSQRTVIRYNGRTFETDNATSMNITNSGKVETIQRTVQDVGHTRGRYVKYVIERAGLTWIGELAAYDENNALLTSGKTVKNLTNTTATNDYAKDLTVLTDGSVRSGKNKYTTSGYYVGLSNGATKHELRVDLGSIKDIYRFGVSYSANSQSVDGIYCPKSIEIYVSNNGTDWTYASTIPVTRDSSLTAQEVANDYIFVKWQDSYVNTSGTDAQAYWNPYTVTRTFKQESLDAYYAHRNTFMPKFENYGNNLVWMYGTTKAIDSAKHIAPDVIKIDGLFGDAGWSADKWIKADADVNATEVGKNIKSQHQMRTDGEYLYVSALVDSANPEFKLWLNYGDDKIKTFEIKAGSTDKNVLIPEFTGQTRVDDYKLEAGEGNTFANNTVTYPFALSAKEWNGSSWTELAYEDSTFYGTTKELLESTSDGVWIWEGRPQTQGFRFGNESAVIKPSEADNGAKSVIEFKIALDEIGGANGFKYFFAVTENGNGTYYPKIYGDVTKLDTDPVVSWFNTSKVVTAADLKDNGKLWLRNDYAPMTSLGAKVNDAYGENKVKAIRFAARYTEDFIRRSNAKEGTNYWMVADAGIVILPTAMISETCPLAIENENVAKASALDIVDWKNEAPNGETNFADYESFVFYVNLVGVDNIVDVPLTFSAYIDYYENYNGSETFYSIPLERSYTFVEQTATEGEILLIDD